MYWTQSVQLWAAAVVVVVVRPSTATRTPAAVSPPATKHEVITVKHHNYTLPILLLRKDITPSSTHNTHSNPSPNPVEYVEKDVAVVSSSSHNVNHSSNPVEYEEEHVAADDHNSSSEEYKETPSNLPTFTQDESTDNLLVPSESDAPLLESGRVETNAKLPVNSTKISEPPKPNLEVLRYFRQLIEDINSASESGKEVYGIPSVAEGDVKSPSNESDMQQSVSVPVPYLLEPEAAPPTLLYSFPLDSVLSATGVRNTSRLPDETLDGATPASAKDFSITFESPVTLIAKSSLHHSTDQIFTPQEDNRTHHDSPPRLRFPGNTNHSRLNLEGEEELESSASDAREVYYAHLPRPSLTNDHLPAALYQYDGVSSHLVPDPKTVPHYAFEYVMRDPLHGGLHGHSETRRGQDTHGRYFVLLPDGRLQTVTYIANERGYFPQVVYTGDAKPAITIKTPHEIQKPFHQTLKPFYFKDKLVMPHAVLFKPKSAYLIKYGKPFPLHSHSSHGVSLKPKYVTPTPIQPFLKPTHSPGPTSLPHTGYGSPPIPIFPPGPHQHLPGPAPSISVVSGSPLSPFTHSSTTVSPKPSPHPIRPTLGSVISPKPHIITKSQHSPFSEPPSITTTHSKVSHFFPPVTPATPKPPYRPGITTTIKPDFFPHHSTTITTTSHPKLPPLLSTFTPTPEPFFHPTHSSTKPGLTPHPHPHPHIVTTSHSSTVTPHPHPPTITTLHPDSPPFLPTITTKKPGFTPSHPAPVITSIDSHHPPHITTSSPHHSSHPPLITTSLPKFSHPYSFLSTSGPKVTHHSSVVTLPPPPFYPTSPRPTPFPPSVITTAGHKPHHPSFHHNHHHISDHDVHFPFSSGFLDTHGSKTAIPSVTTSIVTPDPHNHLTIFEYSERPRRLATTTATTTTATSTSKERKPTLKPKPVFTSTESSSEYLYGENLEKTIFVTARPESGEKQHKDYRLPKSRDVLKDSFLATLKPGNFERTSKTFITTPATYTSRESREDPPGTPTPKPRTPTPASFHTVSDVRVTTTTTPNDIDGSYETPFSPSKPISIDFTPKRPPLAYNNPSVQSQALPLSYHADPHKYSIGIRVKPRTPPASLSHGVLYRSNPVSPSSHNNNSPYHSTRFQSYLDTALGSPQSRESISFAPASHDASVNPYLESFLHHQDLLITPWSNVPQTLPSMNKDSYHARLFDPHTSSESSEQQHHQTQLQSWRPLAGPVRFPSASYTPFPSSSVKRAAPASYRR
ncbi:mucin-2-like [Scylla paramamosain]|uniref:mucin-2-like n=1 Tax=Scylla paramamosain TaxID=85552 RepID=UPI003082AFD5